MLKQLIQLLNRDLSGRAWETESSHPFFGDIVLFAFKNSDDSYWEAEIETEGRSLTVIIQAPDRLEPTEKHVQFIQDLLLDQDATYGRVSELFSKEYAQWYGQPLLRNWRAAFRLVAITIPVGCDQFNDWDISYECLSDGHGHHFTCYFAGGKASGVSVDG